MKKESGTTYLLEKGKAPTTAAQKSQEGGCVVPVKNSITSPPQAQQVPGDPRGQGGGSGVQPKRTREKSTLKTRGSGEHEKTHNFWYAERHIPVGWAPQGEFVLESSEQWAC